MEPKESEQARCAEARYGIQVKSLKRLLYTLDSDATKQLSARLQKQLMGTDGLQLLAVVRSVNLP